MLKENPVLLLLQQFVSLKPYPAADRAVLERILQLIETFSFAKLKERRTSLTFFTCSSSSSVSLPDSIFEVAFGSLLNVARLT